MRLYLWVAAGSGAGGLLRYLVSAVWYQFGEPSMPWPTLTVNVFGSLLVGLYFALTGPDGRLIARPEHRVGVIAGFCGGLTTFSIFSLETLVLLTRGQWQLATVYVTLSLGLWMSAVWIGYAWGGRLNRLAWS